MPKNGYRRLLEDRRGHFMSVMDLAHLPCGRRLRAAHRALCIATALIRRYGLAK